jgi:hypothetical protein
LPENSEIKSSRDGFVNLGAGALAPVFNTGSWLLVIGSWLVGVPFNGVSTGVGFPFNACWRFASLFAAEALPASAFWELLVLYLSISC